MRSPKIALPLVVAFAVGCSSGGDEPDPTVSRGRSSSFESAGVSNGAKGGSLADARTEAGAPTAANMMREVEEADIIKSDGAGHLFVVNAYRGLQVLDVTNP